MHFFLIYYQLYVCSGERTLSTGVSHRENGQGTPSRCLDTFENWPEIAKYAVCAHLAC